jgi:hypothetical protein
MPRRFATVALIAVAAGSLLAVPAQGRTGRHCAYRLVTIARHGSVNVTRPDLIGCYTTFSDAVAAGTNGGVRLAQDMTPSGLRNADLRVGTSASEVVIGLEYPQMSFGGVSTIYSAAATCSANNIIETNYVGDALNDRFSSGKGFGGCDHNKKFQNADFGGDVLTCTPNCTNYGTLSNQVSSLRWRP